VEKEAEVEGQSCSYLRVTYIVLEAPLGGLQNIMPFQRERSFKSEDINETIETRVVDRSLFNIFKVSSTNTFEVLLRWACAPVIQDSYTQQAG
jgi:hypothetical protein